MAKTKPNTLEEHVAMGQLIKDACNAVRAVEKYGEEHGMLMAKDIDRLLRQASASPAMEKLRCRLDGKVFRDCPWLTNDAFSVYYHDEERADAGELRELAKQSGRYARFHETTG